VFAELPRLETLFRIAKLALKVVAGLLLETKLVLELSLTALLVLLEVRELVL